MTEPIQPAAIAILRSTPATLRSLVVGVPDETLLAPVDDGWSVGDAEQRPLSHPDLLLIISL
jgi:hypothetical protein